MLRAVGCFFSFLFKFQYNILHTNSGDPDQNLRFAASDLVLHYLPKSHKKDANILRRKSLVSTDTVCNTFVRQS